MISGPGTSMVIFLVMKWDPGWVGVKTNPVCFSKAFGVSDRQKNVVDPKP